MIDANLWESSDLSNSLSIQNSLRNCSFRTLNKYFSVYESTPEVYIDNYLSDSETHNPTVSETDDFDPDGSATGNSMDLSEEWDMVDPLMEEILDNLDVDCLGMLFVSNQLGSGSLYGVSSQSLDSGVCSPLLPIRSDREDELHSTYSDSPFSNVLELHDRYKRYGNSTEKERRKMIKRNQHLRTHIVDPEEQAALQCHRCCTIDKVTKLPCNKIFSRSYDLARHQDTVHANQPRVLKCLECGEESKTFSRQDALVRHKRAKHGHDHR